MCKNVCVRFNEDNNGKLIVYSCPSAPENWKLEVRIPKINWCVDKKTINEISCNSPYNVQYTSDEIVHEENDRMYRPPCLSLCLRYWIKGSPGTPGQVSCPNQSQVKDFPPTVAKRKWLIGGAIERKYLVHSCGLSDLRSPFIGKGALLSEGTINEDVT